MDELNLWWLPTILRSVAHQSGLMGLQHVQKEEELASGQNFFFSNSSSRHRFTVKIAETGRKVHIFQIKCTQGFEVEVVL